MTTTNAIPTIPLNKLVPFAGNVRKTHNKVFIDELAASIKAHDLQQNLVVKPQGKHFAVVAGGQRLKALQLLAKNGDIKATHPVPCKIAEGDIDATELSLLENVVREDMHPADAFEAFRDLVDKGVPVPDIAARFARPESYIRQLLRLARVSPVILAAYREGKLDLEQTKAFAITDDHAAQESVCGKLRSRRCDPRSIRDMLTENEIPATDRRVKFATLKAYRKAGGAERIDLFSEGDDSVFLQDTALLDRLIAEKLQRVAQSVTKEGWKWLEAHAEFGYEQKGQFKRVHAQPAPLPTKLAAKYAALEQELSTLRDQWDEADDEDEQPERIGIIEQRLEEMDAQRGDDVWTAEQLATAGVVITIGHDGKAEILRGLVKPEDMPKKKQPTNATPEAGAEEHQFPALSSALAESLTAQRSAALAAELRQRPDIALAATVHALASRVMLRSRTGDTAMQVAASLQSLHRVEGAKAQLDMDAAREEWERMLPDTPEGLWAWCLEQKQDVLLKLLAFCAAATVDAVQGKSDKPDCDRLRNADRLAAALKLDMKAWFTPNAENYYTRVSKPQILEALTEGRSQPPAPAWDKLKKTELAQLAERELAGNGWLPQLLRPA